MTDIVNPKFREEPHAMSGPEMEEMVRLELLRLSQIEETQPRMDRAEAETAVALAYHNSGFKLPKEIRWLDSPFQLDPKEDRRIALLKNCPDETPQRFRNRVAQHVGQILRMRRGLERFSSDGISLAILWAVDSHLMGIIPGNRPRAPVIPRSTSIKSDSAFFVGSIRSNIVHRMTLRLMADKGEPLTALEQVHLQLWDSVWMCLPTVDTAYLCERPIEIRRDRDGRVHCENGPAVRFADNKGVAYWRDQLIPVSWVMGSPPSAYEAMTWPNMDQRAAACEIVGWHHILEELGGMVLDRDPDPMIGVLVEVHLPETFQPQKFIRVMCGTGREFALPVPMETRTALHGQALLHDLPEDVIRSIKKRT